MRKLIWAFAAVFVLLALSLAAALMFSVPSKPPVMASVNSPFANVDFSSLPKLETFGARDGAQLGYRLYPGTGASVVVLIHGSSDEGTGLHVLATALQGDGANVYVPEIRGHGRSGTRGDIDTIGQLEDDLSDFVGVIRQQHKDALLSLVGFSSGGGFVLRVLARPVETLFARFVLISPALPYGAPTLRPGTGGWVSVAVPRIVALTLLNRMGVTRFNGLGVVAFATDPAVKHLTDNYSFRLAANFGATPDYLKAFAATSKPVALLVGGADELFYSDQFAPLFEPLRRDFRVTLVPGVDHINMTLAPQAVAAVRSAVRVPTKP